SGEYRKFDAVLAMYHDQGLAPFKALASGEGVNFTAGLSVVRTSPGHGTAYDIAGRGVADENSLRQAVYVAIDIVRHRRGVDEASANPLKVEPVERRERPRRDFAENAEIAE
ncbi:MAG: 4-hydroxythreonine-4-phosphate dehydrogenase PdxA, partial [Bacteroidaceae bacterium]|nr:4-hydroxythreonine-4-phosphate dehydrogenase PdxA [Bacteroidaceae bacterium]